MKKTATMILAAIMVLAMLAGCGGGSSATATPAPAATEAPPEIAGDWKIRHESRDIVITFGSDMSVKLVEGENSSSGVYSFDGTNVSVNLGAAGVTNGIYDATAGSIVFTDADNNSASYFRYTPEPDGGTEPDDTAEPDEGDDPEASPEPEGSAAPEESTSPEPTGDEA